MVVGSPMPRDTVDPHELLEPHWFSGRSFGDYLPLPQARCDNPHEHQRHGNPQDLAGGDLIGLWGRGRDRAVGHGGILYPSTSGSTCWTGELGGEPGQRGPSKGSSWAENDHGGRDIIPTAEAPGTGSKVGVGGGERVVEPYQGEGGRMASQRRPGPKSRGVWVGMAPTQQGRCHVEQRAPACLR